MQEVIKTYPNGNKLVIYDDGINPVETLKATLSKVFVASDGEEYLQVIQDGTKNDIITILNQLDTRIAALTAERNKYSNLNNALTAELTKLPARVVQESVITELAIG